MYKFKGTEYTTEQLQGVADRKGYTFNELLDKNPEIEKLGKTQPTTQKGAEPVDVIEAPDTESKSETGFLERINNIKKQIEFLQGDDGKMDPFDSPKRIKEYNNLISEYNDIISTTEFDPDLKYTGIEPFEKLREGSVFEKEGLKLRQSFVGRGMQPVALEEVVVTGKDKSLSEQEKYEARLLGVAAGTGFSEKTVASTASLAAGTLDIASGLVNFIENYGVEPLGALMSGIPLKDLYKQDTIPTEAIDEWSRILKQYTIKKFDENGKEMDLYGLIESGRYSDAADLAVNQAIGSAPYLAMTLINPVVGGTLTAASVAGGEFERALKERPNETMESLYLGSALKGGVEGLASALSGGLQRSLMGLGKNASKDVIQKFAQSYTTRALNSIGAGITAGATEKSEEFFVSVAEDLVDVFIYGDQFEMKSTWRKAVNQSIVGFVAAVGPGTAGRFINVAAKQEAYAFISPRKFRNEERRINQQLMEARNNLRAAPPSRKKRYEEQIKVLEQQKQNRRNRLEKAFDNLSKKDLERYAGNLDIVDEALGVVDNKKYSKGERNAAKNRIEKAHAENESILGKDIYSQEAEQTLTDFERAEASRTKDLSFAEKTAKSLGFTGEIKVETSKENVVKKYGEEFGDANAFIVDGEVVVNLEVARSTKNVTSASHEVLHGIVSAVLRGTDAKERIQQFRESLTSEQALAVEKRIKAKDSKGERLYTDEYLEKNPDEYVTQFFEAVVAEEVEIKSEETNFIDKLQKFFVDIFRSTGFANIDFKDGKDVINFVKDYKEAFEKGKLKASYRSLPGIDFTAEDFKTSKATGEQIQKIYEEQGVDGAMEIIEAYKPLTTKITNKYRDVPGFDFELLQSEIEIGPRGLLDLIQAYTPDRGATLNTYVQGQLERRAIEAANRILNTEFTLDVTEAKGVTDTTTEEVTEKVDEPKEIEVESLRKKIGIGDEFKPIVFNAVKKTFGTRLPDVSEKDFIKKLQTGFRTELKKPIAKLMGRTEDYRSFLSDNFENIYNALPQSVINRRLNEFAEPVMKDGKQVREKTAQGKKIFKKKKIVKAEWLKYFLGDNVGRSTQGTRKTALAEALSEAFALDATMEVLADPSVFDKLQQIGEITNNPISENYIDQVSEKIGRPKNMKLSKTSVTDNNSKESVLVKDILGDAFLAADPNKNKNVPFNILLKNFMEHMAKNYSYSDGKPYDAKRYRPILFEYYVGKTISLNNPDLKLINDFKGFDATGAGDLNFVHIPTGKKINVEVKMKATDQMSSGTIKYNTDTKEFEKPKNPIEIFSVVAAALKGAGIDANIDKIFEAAGIKSFTKLTFDQADIVNEMKTKLLNEEIDLGDVSNIINAYKKKGVDFIVLGDQMYSLSENTFGTGIDKLSGKGFIKVRLVWGSKNRKNNTVNGSIRAFNLIKKGTVNKGTNIGDVKFKLSKSLDTEFNQLLQATTGVEYYKTFSPAKARLVGKGKGKRKFFIPYSADDFVGLLYATLGEGKVGDKQMAWYEENLLRPFSRGIQQYEAAKQKAMREWMALSSQIKKDVPGGLNKRNETGFRNQDSLRMYIWAKQGMDVPGAAKKDVNEAVSLVNNDPKLKEFAEKLIALNPEGYPAPGQSWDAGDITTDIVSYVNDVRRGEFLTEWKENVDQIFTDKNKQKLLALYGQNYIDALEDMLHRMKTGRNRKFGITKAERTFMDWTNNSVGAIMFFNARSAVLQTLSAVNFINFSDNNPINAGLAFANQPQYWKDFSTLFNSDFLKQRRTGLQTDVNADEIANAAKSSTNKAKAALSAILKLGFTPTQIADSFAIASGGATFYRNRIKKYIKEGLDKEAAEKKAFTDFQEVAEETQQSARPDRISMQQASSLGRLILAFGNTPMQYARLTKKASLDLINGRGDWKTNISKIAYYSVIQNIIFSALQQGLFALLFDEEDEEKEKSRYFRIGNSSFDTLLRGSGVYGAAAATVKNMIFEIIEQSEKSRPDYTKVAIEATTLSPPINSKLRKLESAGRTFTYKQSKEKVFTEGFSFENPAFLAGGKVISAVANIPVDRVVQKADHIHTAMQDETELWQAIALSLGWSEWDLNMIEKKNKKDFEKELKRIEKILEKY